MRYFVKSSEINNNILRLTPDKAHYLLRVLRIKPKDKVTLIVDEKEEWTCKITTITNSELKIETLSKKKMTQIKSNIHLIQCLPKQDKMTQIIDACTQLGITSLHPVQSERSIVSPNEKQKTAKFERWKKKLISASTQSKQTHIPILHPIQTFEAFIEKIALEKNTIGIVPWEDAHQKSYPKLKETLSQIDYNQEIYIFIGPEGGITENEINKLIEKKFQPVSLGNTILRVEQAGFFTAAQVLYHLS